MAASGAGVVVEAGVEVEVIGVALMAGCGVSAKAAEPQTKPDLFPGVHPGHALIQVGMAFNESQHFT